jgi:uncharacterized protein YkwD
MRRFLTFFITLLLPVSVMAFSDTNGSEYEEAANYLRDNQIVEGYEDGTFRPNDSINRAELTKIVLESAGVDLEPGSDCFPDVDADEWYATYVCTAKSLGWVQGYPDGTFQPARTINRVEAVKIIGEAEGWDLGGDSSGFADVGAGEWYTPYVVFAEQKNFLPLSGLFNPSQLTTRGLFSEVYYRILVTEERGESKYEARVEVVFDDEEEDPLDVKLGDLDDELAIESEGLAQLQGDSYATDTFDDMTLDDPFPKTFFKNEMYFFEGTLDDRGYSKAFVFVYPKGDSDDVETFVAPVNGKDFSIPVFFDGAGDHYIGIIPGNGGSSIVARVSVEADLPDIGELSAPSRATELSAGFSDDQTYFEYDGGGNFNQLVLTQGLNEVFYYQRQGLGKFVVNYEDFARFNDREVSWYINATNMSSDLDTMSNWSPTSKKTFRPVRHEFSRITEDVDVDILPVFYNPGDELRVSGSTDVKISRSLAVIEPDGFVYESDDSGSYNAGSDFDFRYDTSSGGTYIIEVNDLGGVAVINHPVYQSGRLPLLPDYYDLYPVLVNDDSINESSLRTTMLGLINNFRREHGLSTVVLDDDLNDLAQDHSNDMVDNNFFAHINEDNETPNDRRVKAGIDTYVGENISRTSTIGHAHEGFLRSAIHRANVMRNDWTRVGIGVAKNDDGYLLVTQEFSTDETFLYNEIIDEVDSKRSVDVNVDGQLQAIAEEWTDLMVEEDFFDTSYDGSTIFEGTDITSSFSTARAFIISGSSLDLILKSIIESTDVDEEEWTDIGLGLRTTDSGGVKITLVYAK